MMNLLIDSWPYPKEPMTPLERLAEVCSRELKKIQYEEYVVAKVKKWEEQKQWPAAKRDINENNEESRMSCVSSSFARSDGSIHGQTAFVARPIASGTFAAATSRGSEAAHSTPEPSLIAISGTAATKCQDQTPPSRPSCTKPRRKGPQRIPLDLSRGHGHADGQVRTHANARRSANAKNHRQVDHDHPRAHGQSQAPVSARDAITTNTSSPGDTSALTKVHDYVNSSAKGHSVTHDHANAITQHSTKVYGHVRAQANIQSQTHAQINTTDHGHPDAPTKGHDHPNPNAQTPAQGHDHSYAHGLADSRPFVCCWLGCARSFSRRDELHRHLVTRHAGSLGYDCALCDRTFRHAAHLAQHLRAQHNIGGVVMQPRTAGAEVSTVTPTTPKPDVCSDVAPAEVC